MSRGVGVKLLRGVKTKTNKGITSIITIITSVDWIWSFDIVLILQSGWESKILDGSKLDLDLVDVDLFDADLFDVDSIDLAINAREDSPSIISFISSAPLSSTIFKSLILSSLILSSLALPS